MDNPSLFGYPVVAEGLPAFSIARFPWLLRLLFVVAEPTGIRLPCAYPDPNRTGLGPDGAGDWDAVPRGALQVPLPSVIKDAPVESTWACNPGELAQAQEGISRHVQTTHSIAPDHRPLSVFLGGIFGVQPRPSHLPNRTRPGGIEPGRSS